MTVKSRATAIFSLSALALALVVAGVAWLDSPRPPQPEDSTLVSEAVPGAPQPLPGSALPSAPSDGEASAQSAQVEKANSDMASLAIVGEVVTMHSTNQMILRTRDPEAARKAIAENRLSLPKDTIVEPLASPTLWRGLSAAGHAKH